MKSHSLVSYSISSLVLALAACGGGGGSDSATGGSTAAVSGNGASASSAPGAASGTTAAGSSGAAGTTGSTVAAANGATPAAVSPSAVTSAALRMTCASPVTTATSTGGGLITVDTPSADGTRMFAAGSTFPLAITANPSTADTLAWSVNDSLGKTVASGSFAAPSGGSTTTLSCTSTVAGYFAVSATLAKAGGSVQTAGTRPTGFATFGVLPDVTASLPAPTYAHQEQHRFGMQGFNGWTGMLNALGISSTIDDREIVRHGAEWPEQFCGDGHDHRQRLRVGPDHAAGAARRYSRVGQPDRRIQRQLVSAEGSDRIPGIHESGWFGNRSNA